MRKDTVTEGLPRPASSAGMVFGLGEADTIWLAEARFAQLRAVAAALPFALVAQLAATAVALGIALGAHQSAGATAMALYGGGGFAVGLAAWRFAATRPRDKLALRIQTVGALAAGVLMGAAQAFLLRHSLAIPFPAGSAAVAAAAASIAIAAVALLPLRAAGLAYALGAGGVLLAAAGSPLAALFGTLFLALLVALLYRLALFELRDAGRRARIQGESVLAQRLIQEHENHGTGWFWETDRAGRLTYLSDKVVREMGRSRDEVIGRPLTDIFELDSATPETERTLSFHLSSRTSFCEYSVQPAGGVADRWWSISGRPVVDKIGQFRGFIGSGSDLTAKRRAEAEITRLALFDALTGLANRQRMRLTLDQTLAEPKGAYRPTSLFLLDLDRFKAVNDTLGHQVGDELLKQVAQRLQRSIGEAGLVGRVGGDEFEVVLPGEYDRDRLAKLAKAVIASLSQPYAFAGTSISIGCSVGIAVAPDDGEISETLIRNADLALYAAKADGRGVHRFYRPEMLVGAQSRKMLEEDLRRALAEGQFHLAYQPVVSTAGARIVGFEALLRWDHPVRGAVSPAEFIPVAEECGLIEPIGEWVMRTAAAEAASWPGGVRIGVNVSTIQFANPNLPRLVTNVLASSGLSPDRLELEITESVFLDEDASSDKMFASLKAIGVRLALDDFGTGYSSLGYLRNAPFDKIKIDQSFVRGAAIAGNRNAAIIRAIVTLAKTLGMETTAEGVEVQDEIALIRELGCSHIQGFVYGQPMVAAEARRLLDESGGEASASGHRMSRAPRTKMLRSALLEMAGLQRPVRIRNMSTSGAMIDGIDDAEVSGEVLIELIEDQMFRAHVRWARDGKAGLQFAESFNLDRLKGAAEPKSIRRSG